MSNPVKSIVAGLAGIFATVAPTLATDALLHAVGVFPPPGQPIGDGPFVLATIYRVIYGIVGSYVTARLAPNRPMAHCLVLGALGMFITIAGTIATWNKGPAFGPHWYPLALVVLSMPQSWAGAKLWLTQSRPGAPVSA